MSFFKRLFKVGEAEAHSMVDKLEDPIKMTEQGIRDMKQDMDQALKALAEVKALAIRNRNDANVHRSKASEYEKKAVMLLQSAQSGKMSPEEADRLAASALQKKEEALQAFNVASQNQKKMDAQVAQLEGKIKQMKSNISKWENESRTLKARAKVSDATKNVNKQLAQIDSSSTVSMLERMKEKVEKEEALAEAYGDIADENRSLDQEIDSALAESGTAGSDSLAALKAKMGLTAGDTENPSSLPPPLE